MQRERERCKRLQTSARRASEGGGAAEQADRSSSLLAPVAAAGDRAGWRAPSLLAKYSAAITPLASRSMGVRGPLWPRAACWGRAP